MARVKITQKAAVRWVCVARGLYYYGDLSGNYSPQTVHSTQIISSTSLHTWSGPNLGQGKRDRCPGPLFLEGPALVVILFN